MPRSMLYYPVVVLLVSIALAGCDDRDHAPYGSHSGEGGGGGGASMPPEEDGGNEDTDTDTEIAEEPIPSQCVQMGGYCMDPDSGWCTTGYLAFPESYGCDLACCAPTGYNYTDCENSPGSCVDTDECPEGYGDANLLCGGWDQICCFLIPA